MLSLFPQILFLAPFSAFMIRVALAIVLGFVAWKHFSSEDARIRALGVLEVAAATALLGGVWTQGVALAGFAGTLIGFILPRTRVLSLSTMLLALVMFLSLIVTGAGIFAFDLPL